MTCTRIHPRGRWRPAYVLELARHCHTMSSVASTNYKHALWFGFLGAHWDPWGGFRIYRWREFFQGWGTLAGFRRDAVIFRGCGPRQSIPEMILRRHRWCTFCLKLLSFHSYNVLKSTSFQKCLKFTKPRTRPEKVPKKRHKWRISRSTRRFWSFNFLFLRNWVEFSVDNFKAT